MDKADNPGMAELGLQSADVYGGVVVVNFADMTWRTALTSGPATLRPVTRFGSAECGRPPGYLRRHDQIHLVKRLR